MKKTPSIKRIEIKVVKPAPAAQTKRYDEAVKRQAVEHWIKTGQNGMQCHRQPPLRTAAPQRPGRAIRRRRTPGPAGGAGAQPSMSRAGNPYDNAAMESFMATYKRECVALAGGYDTRQTATADFFAYVETYYNRERLHSALGYKNPVDFELKLN